MIGWGPRDMDVGSLAELFAAFDGRARAEGWISSRPQPMTRAELHGLMEQFPDG